MIVKNIEISKIEITAFDPKTNIMGVSISFVNEATLTQNFIFENVEIIPDKIIKLIKEKKTPEERDNGDVLDGIAILNINDEDMVREKMQKYLVRMEQKIRNFRSTKTGNEYINLFKELSVLRATIYSK